MPKRSKAPEGYYTATEVMNILKIPNATLYAYVDRGIIKRVVPPHRQEGYYVKSSVDKLAEEKQEFLRKSLEE